MKTCPVWLGQLLVRVETGTEIYRWSAPVDVTVNSLPQVAF